MGPFRGPYRGSPLRDPCWWAVTTEVAAHWEEVLMGPFRGGTHIFFCKVLNENEHIKNLMLPHLSMPCDNFHFSPHLVLEKYQTSLYSKVFSSAKRGKTKYQASIASGPSSTCKILVSMLKLLTFTQIFSATKQGEKSKKNEYQTEKKPRVQNSELKDQYLCSNSLSSMHFP